MENYEKKILSSDWFRKHLFFCKNFLSVNIRNIHLFFWSSRNYYDYRRPIGDPSQTDMPDRRPIGDLSKTDMPHRRP